MPHQFRVAYRRLRSLLSLAREVHQGRPRGHAAQGRTA
ncbi:MAG: hypothetical protein IPM08_03290 [Actinomycetales bacterium]|nr:hypothetical protein [Actinomycetales bacterium]